MGCAFDHDQKGKSIPRTTVSTLVTGSTTFRFFAIDSYGRDDDDADDDNAMWALRPVVTRLKSGHVITLLAPDVPLKWGTCSEIKV